MLIATIAAEVAFWLCLLLGFLSRYTFGFRRLGLAFLAATPIIDIALLVFGYLSIKEEGSANFMHGFAAFYIAFSLVFGRYIVENLDRRFNRLGTDSRYSQSSYGKMSALKKCVLASVVSAEIRIAGIVVAGIGASFWLQYWLVAVAFTPLMWWAVDKYFVRKRS